MNYTKVESPKWNQENTEIECIVTFDYIGAVPFNATPNDLHTHGVEIYNRCVAGEFGPIADWVAPPTVFYLSENKIPTTILGEIL
jgi:hypothetical protein